MADTQTAGPRSCDLLVRNAYVLTLDPERHVYPHGAVAIQGGEILAVGPEREVATAYQAARTIDAQGAPVHPGFVDGHAHVTLHSTRGAFAEGDDEATYFRNYIDWTDALDPDEEYASALLAGLEMLRNGVTCFLEPGTAWEPDAVASAVDRVGIRASVADPYIWDVPNYWYAEHLRNAPSNQERAMRLLGTQLWRNKDPNSRVRGHVGLYGIGSATDELALAAKEVADRNDTFLTMHQSFELADIEGDDQRFGMHPLVHYAEIGLLGPNLAFAHMNAVRDDEVGPVVESGMAVVWNPGNYLYWSVGDHYRTRMPELNQRGVPVAFGTDVAKVWAFGDQGLLGYLVAREKSAYVSAEDILAMQTINGARAMQAQDRIGSLEPGKRADLVIHTSAISEQQPVLDVVRNLALVSRTKSVRTVVVDGQVVLEDGRPTRVDEAEVYEAARASADRMVRKVGGPKPGTTWPTVE